MKKIQTKITLLILAATLGISIINVSQSMAITSISTTSAIEKNLSETAELAALAAQNIISTYTLVIAEIASNPTLLDDAISLEDKQAFIQTRVDAYYMRFGGIADTNGYDAVHNRNISSEPFFQASMGGENCMSAPYIDGTDSYIMVSSPIIQEDRIQGVVYFQCDTYILQSIVESIQVGEEGDAYILDKEGTVIAYVEQQSVLERENVIKEAAGNPEDKDLQKLAAIEKKMIAGDSGVEKYTYTADNASYIQGFAPIAGTDGWSIAVTISEDEFMRTAYIGNLVQLIISVAIFLIIMVLSFMICRSIAGPVVKCAKRLQMLSEGDLNSPVPKTKSKDETRILLDSTAHLVETFRTIVEEMGTVLNGIAGGDLTRECIDSHYPGDFRALSDYLRIINEKLNQTMTGIVSAANRLSGDSAQMASTSERLSEGAIEQASAVTELSSTVENMSNTAKKTSQLAEDAKSAANNAGVELLESSMFIEHLNEAMDLITDSSGEIRRIIDTIENISFQTNILALNASVEASRAGEAGKGFAVVAAEVRDLASKSDQAAKATQELIKRSIDAVESGSEVVSKVTKSVTEAVELAGHAVAQMENLAEAVEQQTGAIEQVSEGINQISGVVQSNSSMAQESASTSRGLSEQANVLKDLVGSFSLR